MKRVDQEAGVWGTGRDGDRSRQAQSQAPSIPRYEEPVNTPPVSLTPQEPPEQPTQPEAPKDNAPDRPDYE
jgi:cell division septation protein DedD